MHWSKTIVTTLRVEVHIIPRVNFSQVFTSSPKRGIKSPDKVLERHTELKLDLSLMMAQLGCCFPAHVRQYLCVFPAHVRQYLCVFR